MRWHPSREGIRRPQPGALGFHHRQHRLGAHQGIDGTATRLQCSDSGFCGEGIGGHHHRAAAGGDTLLAAEISGFRIVAADRCCCGWSGAAEGQHQRQCVEDRETRRKRSGLLAPSLKGVANARGSQQDDIVWLAAVSMKPISAFGWSLGIALLCGSQALAQTNQQLLQDGLISPLVFELLERRGAKTPEQRFAVIEKPALRVSCPTSTVGLRGAEGAIDHPAA